jgi:hypothetical protein
MTISPAWAAGQGADTSFELLAPAPDSNSIFGKPFVPQHYPVSQARTVSEACNALIFVLGTQDEQESSTRGCTASNAHFFAQVRGQDAAFASVRFKLNSEDGDLSQDLAELNRLVGAFHDIIGWPVPRGSLDRMIVEMGGECRLGALEYEFARERVAVPRFNLTIRTSSNPLHTLDKFENTPTPCVLISAEMLPK